MKAKEGAFKHIEMLLDDVYEDGYNKGVEDCWEFCKKLILDESRGGWSPQQMVDIFGGYDVEVHESIFEYAEGKDVLDCYKDYLKKHPYIKL